MARKEYNPQGWEQGDEWRGEWKRQQTQSQQDPRKGEPKSIYYLVLYYAHTFLASSAAVLWFSAGAIKEVDVIKCSFACR